MCGRPQVLGLLAFAAALWFASPVAAPPAAAEIRIPIPGLFEKKKAIKRKRYVRPTVPSRNPTRATARLTAIAVSPPQARNSEVATAAGATSSASVSLALPKAPEQKAEAEQSFSSTETPEVNPSSDAGNAADRDDAAAPGTTTETAETESPTEPPKDEPDEVAEETASQSVDAEPAAEETKEQISDGFDASAQAAATDNAAQDAKEEDAAEVVAEVGDAAEAAKETAESAADTVETASDDAKEQVTDTAAAAEADEEAPSSARSDEKAEKDAADEKKTADADTSPEPSKDDKDASADADEKAVEAKSEMAAAGPSDNDEPKPAETAEPSKDGLASADDASTDASDAKDVAVSTATAALPDHDASVVLDVAPPPDDSAPAMDAQTKDDPKETDVAVLTPPSTPDKMAPATDEETSEATESDSAGTETGSEEAPVNGDVSDQAETSEDETQSPDAAADGKAEEVQVEAEEEVAAEPAPPPAHPIVAQVREGLEDPALAKTVAASDLKALKAFYGAHEGPPLWVTEEGFTAKAQALIAEIGKADDWGLEASSFELPPANDLLATSNAIADDELQLSIATLGYARDAQIGRLTPKRVSKLFDQHPSLRDPQAVLKETAAADSPSAYLVSLHPQQDQFKRLQKALLRARQSAEATGRDPRNDRNVQLITINMERWRWLPRNLGNYHVWNNVPEYNVRVKKDGRTIYQEKTIVGQLKYATPFFSAKMRNIVFHPNWTVPPTIVKEDIAPKLQGAGGGGFFGSSKEATLRRYGLKANYRGKPINADTVDWKNVNVHAYTFVQDPGPANVLGKFKFNFPNKHAIYMHDTVQPELFSQRTRTLSHGCIRVHQPDRLATLLLAQDKGWNSGNVRSLVARNESKVISLNRHVPVHMTYFTAIVDQSGNLSTPGDIYGLDNLMAPKLFKNPAAFPMPAPAAIAESSPSRSQSRGRRRGNGNFNNFITGLFGN